MSLSEPVKEFEQELNRPENEQIIQFLKQFQPSAHNDIVQILVKSAEQLPDVHFYCPDTDNHAYYLAHTSDGVIFAAAMGMSALMYRLPRQSISASLTKGGEILQEIGEPWVSFNPFWPEEEMPEDKSETFDIAEMQHWCNLAYHYALKK